MLPVIKSCPPLHLYYPLFLLHHPLLRLFLLLLYLTFSSPFFFFPSIENFNFMPPALALGPLVSARLALSHTASLEAPSLPNTHMHTQKNPHTQPQICMLSPPQPTPPPPRATHRHSCRTYGNKMIQKVALKSRQRHTLSEM